MIKLPAGTSPADGFVRATTCPTRVCLPRTVKPSLMSSSRAWVKVIPTTSGTGTSGGVLEADALTEGLAVGLPDAGAAVELAGAAEGELGWVTERDVAGATAAVGCCGAAAELDLDADPAAASGVAAAWPVAA